MFLFAILSLLKGKKCYFAWGIDGDTSTNDMVCVLANGMAGNKEITADGEDFDTFMKALNTVTVHLCRRIAGDGEGATFLTISSFGKSCLKSILI